MTMPDLSIARLKCDVRHYAWGSTEAMSRILAKDPSGEPEAELWMGAHPSAPSQVLTDTGWQPLDQLIAAAPVAWLGDEVAERFDGKLPFLFKILAADQPLSLQAHPTKTQAEEGFAREEEEGIPRDAGHRNYKDDNHKPEIICALTDFWALCGFKPVDELSTYLRELNPPALKEELQAFLASPGPETLQALFARLLELEGGPRDDLVISVVRYAENLSSDPRWEWILKIHDQYPGDIGVAAASLLNVLHLEPGQSLYQGAGLLHAYLHGVGVELMANSDNVLRGGLTPKHVDIPELVKTLSFEPGRDTPAGPTPQGDGSGLYSTPSDEFQLSVLPLTGGTWNGHASHSLEIWCCLEGELTASGGGLGQPLELQQGDVIVVPAAAGAYSLSGTGNAYRATVPG